MTLKLYHHPLSSYSWKVLIALKEKDIEFESIVVDASTLPQLLDVWPLGKFPVLVDEATALVIPESSIIIEYLDNEFPKSPRLLPRDPGLARQVRMRDRFFDNYIMTPMQKLVAERLRPLGEEDPYGARQALEQLRCALKMVEQDLKSGSSHHGDCAAASEFTMADCAAGPSLYYANKVLPFGDEYPLTTAYLERLMTRPSFAKVLEEAKPYFALFPAARPQME